MTTLRMVIPGLVAALALLPTPAASNPRLSEEVAAAIAPTAQGDAPTTPAEPAAPAPAAEVKAEPNATPPPAAEKDKKATASLTAEEVEEQSGWGLGVDLDHTMSTYTFVEPGYYTNYVGGSLGVGGRYSFKLSDIKLSLSAKWGVSVEYTPPADDNNGRRFSHSDLRIGLSAPGILKIPVVDIKVSPSIGITVPLTAESWNAGLILGASAGVSASRGWKYVDVSLSGSISHGFYTSTANYGVQPGNVFSPSEGEGRATFLCRTGEAICGIQGMNPALGIGGNLAVNIRPIDALSFGITFGLGKTWNYATTDVVDEYTPKALDSNGNPVAGVGMKARDRMSTNISASYSFTENVAATLYLQNSQQPLQVRPENGSGYDSLRFPFADIVSRYGGSTALGLTVSANF